MNEVIKIAFVGTSCIGKTTVIEDYKKSNIPGLATVDEAARSYFARHPNVTDRFSVGQQSIVQSIALKNEKIAHSTGASRILCDRSVLDAVAYVKSEGDNAGATMLLNEVRFWIPSYQHILLLNPTDVPYKIDTVRQEDELVRQRFHNAFIEMFEQNGIPYELLSGTLEQRTNRVDQLLKL